MHTARSLVAAVAATTLLAVAVPMPARAALVDSAAMLHPGASAAHERIAAFLAREDVRAALVREGVDPAQARLRAAALTDSQAADLAGRIDQVPAGGDVLGLLFTVFVILLVTDILGLTKVFPFTRPIR